jgi:hypothetical protein
LLYTPRKTKSTAATSTAEQKIPTPALTHPCGDFRALANGASGITVRSESMNVSVIAWWYCSFNTTRQLRKVIGTIARLREILGKTLRQRALTWQGENACFTVRLTCVGDLPD